MMRFVVVSFVLLLTACESNPPAPVIERASTSKPKPPEPKPTSAKTAPTTAAVKDWRPDSHIVKKGDTLFGIGLEYGIDYKEIAAANNLAPPYPIKIGQKLDLSSFKTKTATAPETNNSAGTGDDGSVVITPIKIEPAVTGQESGKPVATPSQTTSVVTPVLSEPKATREPYSKEAFSRATPSVATSKPAETKSLETKPTDTKDDESIDWAWPTQGKVLASFNEVSNKGIDIGGGKGQPIVAASGGKVIYSGSDLRGYGKLVIIKHNKTYLSVYAHNSKIIAKEGQVVTAGQKIAEMGDTDSNSVKLHFEIRRLGKSVDPAKYLTQN